jgi:aryl-alcohol dehydrogenase-like predicted oxidoreductase
VAEVAAAAQLWVLDHAEVSTLAVGVRTVAEFDADADAAGRGFSDRDRELLDRVLGADSTRAAVAETQRSFRA